MVIKSEPTTTNSSPAMPAAAMCGNCGAEERQLLHQVRHRNIFRRLCTTCVLRLHPQSFCPTCFHVYTPTPPNDAVRTCAKCYSHSHAHCVESAATSPNSYICPLCVSPNSPLFKLKTTSTESGESCRVMDRDAARMLLAAARIASTSMNKAAVLARAEAERRVKEAAFTRKRAKEALEHVAYLEINEKVRRTGLSSNNPVRRSGGIISNGGGPSVKMTTDVHANVFPSNRDGGLASVGGDSRPIAKREDSNQLLAAVDVGELRENEKIRATMGDDHATAMDVDEGGLVVDGAEEVGEVNKDNSTDLVAESNQGENVDEVMIHDDGSGSGSGSGLSLQNKESNNGVEQVES